MVKELTAKQQVVWDMRRPIEEGGRGLTMRQIGTELGISTPVVHKSVKVIRKKLGLGLVDGRKEIEDDYHPVRVAAALDAASDVISKTQKEAIERVNASLKEAGIPDRVSAATVKRMLVKYAGVVTVKKQINTNEILKTINEELHLISSYIDDKVVSEASLRDLAMAKAALIEKRALLRGEPTQIVSDLERKHLNELLPLLSLEMQRRGITIQGEIVDAEPIQPAS